MRAVNNVSFFLLFFFTFMMTISLYQCDSSNNLPKAIGEPLELVIIKDKQLFGEDFYKSLKFSLHREIGPSPQPEKTLSIIEIDVDKFTGILKRHQNLLFIKQSETFNIGYKKNMFASNQLALILSCPQNFDFNNNGSKLDSLLDKIRSTEINRMISSHQRSSTSNLSQQIRNTHNLEFTLPSGFFNAYQDSLTTWIRRETPKISQGIFLSNLNPGFNFLNSNKEDLLTQINLKIRDHISGPIKESYMVVDKEAPITLDTVLIDNIKAIKIQSLWRMENDFMGGIFLAYFLIKKERPILIYSYLYAPGEQKKIPLLQLEALVSTLKKTKAEL